MDALEMAKLIAAEHGCFIYCGTERDKKTHLLKPVFVLYRKAPIGGDPFKIPKPLRLGKRSNPKDILEFVKLQAGIT